MLKLWVKEDLGSAGLRKDFLLSVSSRLDDRDQDIPMSTEEVLERDKIKEDYRGMETGSLLDGYGEHVVSISSLSLSALLFGGSCLPNVLAFWGTIKVDIMEKDVFLICSNAMQYNAPATIYFRQQASYGHLKHLLNFFQARSIHELARKDFENLRQDSEDNELELKSVRRGRPPDKSSIKRPVGRPPLERAGSDFSSDTTLATAGDATHDQLRKAHDHAGITDMPTRNSHGTHNGETFGWLAEHKSDRNDDFPGSVLKGLSNNGRKQLVFDENRRSTYKQPNQPISAREPTILTTFDREKQLISVGLHMQGAWFDLLQRLDQLLGKSPPGRLR
ncbi:uncharacterized protein LOC143886053 [Tasmannia lanceolata]|uniref:uncharacterized protein LOC143886053 n=1 Tax=Tasmannia lanceolata TaxID=3420 RepID=UPI0040637590